jgi:hypothetical protein
VSGPEEHREDVVRRLLDRGLSPAALRALLPAFDDVIARVVAERHDGDVGSDHGPGEQEDGSGDHGAGGPHGPAAR